MTDIIQLSPTELKQWQDEGRAFHLLDVRTDEERAICTLPAAIHIPMNLTSPAPKRAARRRFAHRRLLPPRHPQPAHGNVFRRCRI